MPQHQLTAVAFVENLPLRDLVSAFPRAEREPHLVRLSGPQAGATFLFPFGAAAFQDLGRELDPRPVGELLGRIEHHDRTFDRPREDLDGVGVAVAVRVARG